MIDEFKVRYYYKFIGNKNHYCWDDYDMKIILNGKWHKCIYANYGIFAQFEGMENSWWWYKEDFIESKCNPYIKKLLKEIK